MLNIIFSIELILISILGARMLPRAIKYWASLERKKKLLAASWSALLIGQHQIFEHDSLVQSISAINTAAAYQIGWMMVAGLIALPVFLSSKVHGGVWKLPIVAFVAYIFFAIGSTFLSIAPSITLYRSLQLVVVLMLVILAYSEARRNGRPEYLFDVTVFWLIILLITVLIGALVMPDRALSPNSGALGFDLRGVIPSIHQNELGLMSALGLMVGLVKAFGAREKLLAKNMWLAVAIMSGTILFLTQARTSLAAALVAIIMAGLMIRKMRWIAYAAIASSIAAGFFYMIVGSQIGFEDKIEEYARRGVSDEHIQTLSGRTGLWAIGWEMFKDAPVLGHGFQAGVRYKAVAYGLPLGTNMHSSHMQVLVDLGILGYTAWIFFVIGVAAKIYSVYKRESKGSDDHVFAVLVVLLIFVILFRSVLGHVLVSLQVNLLMFLSLYIYAVVRLDTKKGATVGLDTKKVASNTYRAEKNKGKKTILSVRGERNLLPGNDGF